MALGPARAEPELVLEATRQLALLVQGGTETAAGAGVDLGGGFTSVRVAGAHGDRRDAVLAALRFLGVEGAHRLGERAAVLVALFGLSVTKRVGAAAHAAVREQRWAALQLASATSDLLGPEQLERVLELRAPESVGPFPRGAASTLAGHLSTVLGGYSRPRRLNLVISLWDHVCALVQQQQRRRRLATSQVREDRIHRLRDRYRTHFDEPMLRVLCWDVGASPTVAAAARWHPPAGWAANELGRLLQDAIAAIALLRFAKAMSDEGLEAATRTHRHELVAADFLSEEERSSAAHRSVGVYSHPARPGCYVHQLARVLSPDRTLTARTETYVKTRTAMARNYAVVVLETATGLVSDLDGRPLHSPCTNDLPWKCGELDAWRTAVGFSRTPETWEQPPLADVHAEVPVEPLARRVAEDPASREVPHDLLWLGDLADALAPFYGNDHADVQPDSSGPLVDYRTRSSRRERASLPLVVARVAQLVMFGATPPQRCVGWEELATGVGTDAVVAEASTGVFPVPPELADVDTQIAGLSVELARDPRQLADWSAYMGNCIGTMWYADEARRGLCVLAALRSPVDNHIIANVDIRRHTGGWHVHELRARFNNNVASVLEEQVKRWVESIPPVVPIGPDPLPVPPPVRTRGGAVRRSALSRFPTELVRSLIVATEQELNAEPVGPAIRAYAALAGVLDRPVRADVSEPETVIFALKRAGALAGPLRAALDAGVDAESLWRASGVRPLAAAVAKLDTGLRQRYRLQLLIDGSELPRTLGALVRRPEIAPAHALDVVGRSLRAAIGELATDDLLVRSVARNPVADLVCALIIAITCASKSTEDGTVPLTAPGKFLVPGFPVSDLSDQDGPWQRSMASATELGAPVELFWERVADHGLLAPALLLGRGGWAGLWRRAHR
ncbi:hypothetical protein AB0E59_41270 [Lentzea sp. NPDC034063]|uniref:hypothetical protein n=1 Tax=unclassified Lentzea TaxID=2643253 RepID=UPI0033EBD09F